MIRQNRKRKRQDRIHSSQTPRRYLGCEGLEQRLLLTGVTFTAQAVAENETPSATYAVAVDLDSDNDMDILVASGAGVGWFRNTDGAGTFGALSTIASVGVADFEGGVPVAAGDVDGDGDPDVVSIDGNFVVWFENVTAGSSFGSARIITTQVESPKSVHLADLDSDGDLDVLSASARDDRIAWHENLDGQGEFGPQQTLTTATDYAISVFAADFDGDGDLDIVSASPGGEDKLSWFENFGSGIFGPEQIIADRFGSVWSTFATDMDGDGDVDVVSASAFDDRLSWHENLDGQGQFGPPRLITNETDSPRSVIAADLDGDGDADVLSASPRDDKVAWYQNLDGQGTFGPQRVLSAQAAHALAVTAADLDGDGDVDVLSSSYDDNTVAVYMNTDGQGTFGPRTVLSRNDGAEGASDVAAADMDGDGDLDIVSASRVDDTVAWYDNTDEVGGFGSRHIVSTTADEVLSIHAADVDGDGDNDVLSAARDRIVWYDNLDGRGNFSQQQIISTNVDIGASVVTGDLDGDGDLDVVTASYGNSSKITWYQNSDGLGSFVPQPVISSTARGAVSVIASDIDGDGDLDVSAASFTDDTVAWYENEDGLGTFGPMRIISDSMNGANAVVAADIDGDGDADLVATSFRDDTAAWFENLDGAGSFGGKRVITDSADRAWDIRTADVNQDGNLDVVIASEGDGILAWYENEDGLGGFGPRRIVSDDAGGAVAVFTADIDADGDSDILSASRVNDRIAWYENMPTVNGDFNHDGQLNLVDIDLLYEQMGSARPAYDLNGSGQVDNDDVTFWLSLASDADPLGRTFRRGDANLDGYVDISDYNVWNLNKLSNSPRWSAGDFNADGVVDVSDFNIWNASRFQSADFALRFPDDEQQLSPIASDRLEESIRLTTNEQAMADAIHSIPRRITDSDSNLSRIGRINRHAERPMDAESAVVELALAEWPPGLKP